MRTEFPRIFLSHLESIEEEIDRNLQILNCIGIERRLDEVCGTLREEDRHLLLYVDLQGMKEINWILGWESGDVMLRHVARRLEVAAGSSGVVARTNGCHFMLFRPNVSPDRAFKDACELARAIEDMRVAWDGARLQVAVWVAAIPLRKGCPSFRGLRLTGAFAVLRARHAGMGPVHVATHYYSEEGQPSGIACVVPD